MGSIDIPPFLRDKMKQKVQDAKTQKAPAPESIDVPDFLKKKDGTTESIPPLKLGLAGSKAELSASTGPLPSTEEKTIDGTTSSLQEGIVEVEQVDIFNILPSSKKISTSAISNVAPGFAPKETEVTKSLKKVSAADASLEDIETLYRKSPEQFELIRQQVAPNVLMQDVAEGKNQEDNFLWRVFASYKDKADEVKASMFRAKAVGSLNKLADVIPSISREIGKQYVVPQSLPEVKAILADINQTREILDFTKDSGGTEGFVEYAKKKKQFEDNIGKAMPPLKDAVSKFIFEEQSATNPNITPLEVGQQIYKELYPKQYQQYILAGGDKLYRAGGGFGQGFSETPKFADEVNRTMNQLGINAFQMFGNKAARDAAENDAKSLGWKFTLPLEEETKHMIAAKLKESGINPRKASEEEKDAAAETLPDVNKNIWFDKNKEENNVSMPSTGFGYSLKNSYYNTVEDAAQQLVNWFTPGKTRERALSSLKGQTVSETLGENPESKQRLNQLRQKEKESNLTPTEIKEKDELEKYTDIRSNWDKFKDLSGQGVGQFAGFGTISAFTGGLGNAKSVLGATKALISPAADRGGMLAAGYLMSFEQNAEESTRLFPGENDGIKRFVFSNVASGIDTFVERLFPEEKFLSGVLKKDIARLIPNLTEKNLRKELNAGLAEKITKTIVKGIIEQQKTPLQESAEEIISAQFKSMFQGMLDPGSDPVTFGELIDIGTQAYLSSQLLGVPKGIMAQRNKSVPLNAIWDVAADPEQNVQVKATIQDMLGKKELTQDQANERISLLTTAEKTYKENPVLSGDMGGLSLPAKQNYLARLLNEKVLEKKAEETTDEVLAKQYNSEISESKKIREGIFNGEVPVSDRNEEQTKEPSNLTTDTALQEGGDALKDVESTAKALEDAIPSNSDYAKITALIPDEKFDRESSEEVVSEEYHKAKADGSNPALVKAVEDALTPTSQPTVNKQAPTPALGSVEGTAKVPKEISDLYNEAASLRFTLNALKQQMGGRELVGKSKTEYERTKTRLDNIELKLSEYEKSKENKPSNTITETKKEAESSKQLFQDGQTVNYYDDLFNKTSEVKILYKTGDGEKGTERYQVQYEDGKEASVWSNDLKAVESLLGKEQAQPTSQQTVNEVIPELKDVKEQTVNNNSEVEALRQIEDGTETEIKEAIKPDLKLELIDETTLDEKGSSKDMEKHLEVSEKFEGLKKIVDCIYGSSR